MEEEFAFKLRNHSEGDLQSQTDHKHKKILTDIAEGLERKIV